MVSNIGGHFMLIRDDIEVKPKIVEVGLIDIDYQFVQKGQTSFELGVWYKASDLLHSKSDLMAIIKSGYTIIQDNYGGGDYFFWEDEIPNLMYSDLYMVTKRKPKG